MRYGAQKKLCSFLAKNIADELDELINTGCYSFGILTFGHDIHILIIGVFLLLNGEFWVRYLPCRVTCTHSKIKTFFKKLMTLPFTSPIKINNWNPIWRISQLCKFNLEFDPRLRYDYCKAFTKLVVGHMEVDFDLSYVELQFRNPPTYLFWQLYVQYICNFLLSFAKFIFIRQRMSKQDMEETFYRAKINDVIKWAWNEIDFFHFSSITKSWHFTK